jgi:hypothetical protein
MHSHEKKVNQCASAAEAQIGPMPAQVRPKHVDNMSNSLCMKFSIRLLGQTNQLIPAIAQLWPVRIKHGPPSRGGQRAYQRPAYMRCYLQQTPTLFNMWLRKYKDYTVKPSVSIDLCIKLRL